MSPIYQLEGSGGWVFGHHGLNQNWFTSLDDARRTLEAWRHDYNQVRPHQSLGWLTPEVFAGNLPSGAALRASPPGRLPSPLSTCP